MATVAQRATLDDLIRVSEKAELVGGRIVRFMSTGIRPSEVFGNIYVGLRGDIAHAEPAVPGWTMAVDEVFA